MSDALDPADPRSVRAEVAGPAALLVAKAHKLHDRTTTGKAERIDDKDAADVVRLMQTTSAPRAGATFSALLGHPVAGGPSADALVYLEELFGRRGGAGIELASRALRVGMPEERVEALCTAVTAQLLRSAGT